MNSIPRAKPKAVARRPRQSNTPPVSKDAQPVPVNVKSLEINKSTGPSQVPPRNVVGKMSTAPRAQAQPPSKRIGVQFPPNPLSVIPKEEKKVRKKFFNLHLTNGMFLFKVEVEVMYPQRMDNLASINDELQHRIRAMLEEKAKLQAASRKEKKLSEEKIASVEESAKVMEELLQEAQVQKENLAAKLEEQEKRASALQSKISSMEEASRENTNNQFALQKMLRDYEKSNSELKSKMKLVEDERNEKDSNEKKLANIIIHLETQLKEAAQKVEISEETNKWKEKFLSSEEKLRMVLNKKKASHSQQICQLQDKLNAISGRANEEIKAKEREIVSLKKDLASLKETSRICEEKEQSLLSSIKEKSSSVAKLEGEVSEVKASLRRVNSEVFTLKSYVVSLETERNDLLGSKTQLRKSREEADERLCQLEKAHFSEINELNTKYQNLERRQFDELARLEDSHAAKLSEVSAELEKTSVKLKVADDLNRKTANDVTEYQGKVKTYEASNSQLIVRLKDLKEKLQSKEEDLEEMSSRYQEAERRLNEASNAFSTQNFQRDNFVSWKTRYEYQINYLTEKLRRVENGVVTPSHDSLVKEAPSSTDEEDENEVYLRLLDTDTSEVITNLKSQVSELQLKTIFLESSNEEKILQYEEVQMQLQSEKEFQKKNGQDMICLSIVSDCINEVLFDVALTSAKKILLERISELKHQVEVREAAVIKAQSDSKEEIGALKNLLKERQEKESSVGEGNNLSRAAFLQCGLLPEDSRHTETAETELRRKIEELEKTLEGKEDHFFREVQVLNMKNSSLIEKLHVLQSESEVSQNSKEDSDKVRTLEANLENLSIAYEKLLQDFKLKDEEFGVMNASLDMEKRENEEVQKENDQLLLEKTELQGKVEAFESSLDNRVQSGSKQQELEIATLRSELVRTKEKLKETQEANIKVHEDLFIEHKEILDGVRSLSSKKRKSLFEDIQEKTKRLRDSDDCDLLDDTINGSINDPKENIGIQMNVNVDKVFEEEGIYQEDFTVKTPQVLLTSWVDE